MVIRWTLFALLVHACDTICSSQLMLWTIHNKRVLKQLETVKLKQFKELLEGANFTCGWKHIFMIRIRFGWEWRGYPNNNGLNKIDIYLIFMLKSKSKWFRDYAHGFRRPGFLRRLLCHASGLPSQGHPCSKTVLLLHPSRLCSSQQEGRKESGRSSLLPLRTLPGSCI